MKLPTRPQIAALLRRLAAAILQALVWFLLLGALGMSLVVAGVAVLFGTGWALIAAGVFLIFTAALIGQGMKHGRA